MFRKANASMTHPAAVSVILDPVVQNLSFQLSLSKRRSKKRWLYFHCLTVPPPAHVPKTHTQIFKHHSLEMMLQKVFTGYSHPHVSETKHSWKPKKKWMQRMEEWKKRLEARNWTPANTRKSADLGASGLQRTCEIFLQQPLVKGLTPPLNFPVTCSGRKTHVPAQVDFKCLKEKKWIHVRERKRCTLSTSLYLFISGPTTGHQHYVEPSQASNWDKKQTSDTHHSHTGKKG